MPLAASARQPERRRRRIVWSLLACVLSAYLLVYLFRRLELRQLGRVLLGLPTWGLLAALGVYFALGLLRAVRFRVLLGPGAALSGLYPVALLHNLLIRTLPSLAGEISYPALLSHYLGISAPRGLASLLGARLAEMIFVICGGGLGLLSLRTPAGRGGLAGSILVAALLISVGGVLFAGPSVRVLGGLSVRLGRWLLAGRSSLWESLARQIEETGAALDQLRVPSTLAQNLLLSASTYGTSLCFQLLLLHLTGIDAPLGCLVAVVSLVTVVGFLPLSVGGLGLVEGGWVAGLTLVAGVPMQRAVVTAFVLHGCQLLCAVIAGAVGYLWLQFGRKRVKRLDP